MSERDCCWEYLQHVQDEQQKAEVQCEARPAQRNVSLGQSYIGTPPVEIQRQSMGDTSTLAQRETTEPAPELGQSPTQCRATRSAPPPIHHKPIRPTSIPVLRKAAASPLGSAQQNLGLVLRPISGPAPGRMLGPAAKAAQAGPQRSAVSTAGVAQCETRARREAIPIHQAKGLHGRGFQRMANETVARQLSEGSGGQREVNPRRHSRYPTIQHDM